MTNPGLSIIVPVYQAEKHLNRCVRSILKQGYIDFELILVDDGSMDQSGILCDQYAQLDPRIKVIHKQNGGPGSARNAGLAVSVGKYIGFVDSDDFIDPLMFFSMLEMADLHTADIVQCGFEKLNSGGDVLYKSNYSNQTLLGSDTCVGAFSLHQNINNYIHCKLFSRKCIENLSFPNLFTSEDAVFILKACSNCDKFLIINEHYYKYIEHPTSLTRAKTSLKHFDSVKGGKLMYEFTKAHFPEYSAYWALYTVLYIVKIYSRTNKTSGLEKPRTELLIDFHYFYSIVKNGKVLSQISFKSRKGLMLFKRFPNVYASIYASTH
jgi:glycosyltransferase involved in cell wall biosynthesis